MPSPCLNCGESVTQSFCPSCGQKAVQHRAPLFELLADFFGEFFSLDGRHLRTAVALWKPGRLTELYLEGKRTSYASPVRVYLVASLLFFLLVGFPPPDAGRINVYVGDMLIGRDHRDPDLGNLRLMQLDNSSLLGRYVESHIQPKLEPLQAMPAQELLDKLFAGLERTVPTTLIFFVPVLALALKLLYVRRSFFYVDHVVFALHFQSFLFLLFVLARLASGALASLFPWILIYLAALAVVPIYMLLALKRVYGQSWLRTSAKGALLAVLYLLLSLPVVEVTMLLVIRAM